MSFLYHPIPKIPSQTIKEGFCMRDLASRRKHIVSLDYGPSFVSLVLCSKSPSSVFLIYWMNECMNERMNEWMTEWMNEWMDGWMDGWMDEWMNEWMNEWTNERSHEWMNEWMNEWMQPCREPHKKTKKQKQQTNKQKQRHTSTIIYRTYSLRLGNKTDW